MSHPLASARLRDFDAAFQCHAHAHLHVLWGLAGTLELEIEGRGLRLPPGHGLVIAPGERHAFFAPRGARCFVVDSNDEAHLARLAPLAGHLRAADASAAHLLRYLASLPQLPVSAADLLVDSVGGSTVPQAHGARRAVDWAALEAWIDANLSSPLDVATLAVRVHLSPTQFAVRCRAELGITPMALVRRQRLAAALRMRGAGVSVAAVAWQCGYRSPSALTAALRRETNP